ncbi:MAG: thiamine-phosphate kinase [Parcubacteria group bacterium]|jgi:thiamine-monophosphate kinase
MLISQIGGEFELIKRIAGKKICDPKVIKGIGDDAAVLRCAAGKYMLFATDMIVENNHFRIGWHSPLQIGKKLMESNVSDIVSMGGVPKYALVSLALKKRTSVEFVKELYRGLNISAARHGVLILGGDTTRAEDYAFNLALIGNVKKPLLRMRSGAKAGDLICVTGNLGKSAAGLRVLEKYKRPKAGMMKYIKKHLEPVSRSAQIGGLIAKYANAMIDVSDGLASEVSHICKESKAGAKIEWEKIPLSKTTRAAAEMTKSDPHEMALYGGEDFEIVFTMPSGNLKNLRSKFTDFSVVGEILKKEAGVLLVKNGKRLPIGRGFNHFR